jgi:hypothetical protein
VHTDGNTIFSSASSLTLPGPSGPFVLSVSQPGEQSFTLRPLFLELFELDASRRRGPNARRDIAQLAILAPRLHADHCTEPTDDSALHNTEELTTCTQASFEN